MLTLSVGLAFTQDDPGSAQQEQVLEVIQLQHGVANEISSTLQRVMRDARVTPDERTNSLIVMGSSESIAAAKSLLAAIDVEVSGENAERSNQKQVRAFPLEHATADGRLLATLSELLRSTDYDMHSLQLALDSRQNQVIASGQTTYLHALESLLTMMDQPASPDALPSGELSVRLLWLVGGDSGATRAVPGDLKAVTDELARYGVSGLKLGAQSITRVSADEEFTNMFSSNVTTGWSHQVEGRVRSGQDEGLRLDIHVRGQSARIQNPDNPQEIIGGDETQFGTTVTTSAGHFVVLSMNPIGDLDSVFVLQIIGAD